MRVRPFFWFLLVFSCMGVLILAATVHIPVPAQLQVQLSQHPTPETPTTLLVRVTDEQGLMVDGAQISSQAWMTNMHMETQTISTTPQGQGTYLVHISFSMAGPWMITVTMQADGFLPLHQTLLVQVQSTPASASLFVQPHGLSEGTERPGHLERTSRRSNRTVLGLCVVSTDGDQGAHIRIHIRHQTRFLTLPHVCHPLL